MGKKNPKQQPKQPNAANLGDTATAPITAEIIAGTSQVDTHAPAITRLSFFNFITIATTDNIKKFLEFAATTPDGENLEHLWERAYEDGFENGRKSLLRNLERKLEDKFEEGVEKGMNIGREEGYTVAKEAFDELINKIRAREDSKIASTSNSSTQTDLAVTLATTTRPISVQTDPTSASLAPYSTSGTQTSPPASILGTTTDVFVQTNPVSTQTSCHIIQLPTSSPTSVPVVLPVSLVTTGTQTEARTSHNLKFRSPTCIAVSQSLALPEDRKNAKIGSTTEISQNFSAFSSITPSATVSNPSSPSTATAAFETRSTMANFALKHEKVENSSISAQTTPQTPVPSSLGLTDDVARVYASLPTPNDVFFQPLTPPTTARSPESPATPYSSGHEKAVFLRAVFESQAPMGSPARTSIIMDHEKRSEMAGFTKIHQKVENPPIFTQITPEPLISGVLKLEDDAHLPLAHTTIITAHETRSESAGLMKKHRKLENSPISTQKNPEPPISTCFSWADDAAKLPTVSMDLTKQPRDLSGLRSSSFPKNPFSSLQHRHQKFNKKRFYFPVITSRYRHYHLSSGSHLHFQNSHHHPRHPFFVSLDWDQDPRLLDLSNALKALGWVRQ
jgi:hypothetical protein